MLTIDSLAAISPGGSNVPSYTVTNQHIDYKFDEKRGNDVPVIGGPEPLFGKVVDAAAAEALIDKGKMVIQSRACIDYHTLFGNGAYYAPDPIKTWLDPAWDYWRTIGGLFSALEPLPLLGMVVHAVYDAGAHPHEDDESAGLLLADGGGIRKFPWRRRLGRTDILRFWVLTHVAALITFAPLSRARGAETDLLDLVEPPGRRCGNIFLLVKLLLADSRRSMELGRSGDRC